jgi:hypothetical protein
MFRRPRFRTRGLGCLGCLPFSGLLIALTPVILIGALIYFLVKRRQPAGGGEYPAAPPPAPSRSLFCTSCGSTMEPGARFCPNCGRQTG